MQEGSRGGGEGTGATVIAVEGYMDVIALHQAGIENAVAPLGTALTENQLELLWKMTPQPVLCFDGDNAGIAPAFRAVELALPHIRPDRTVRFALLPDGKDPDDLVKQEGRAPFDRVMASARSLSDMVWTREVGSGQFETPEERARSRGAAEAGDQHHRRRKCAALLPAAYARPAEHAVSSAAGRATGSRRLFRRGFQGSGGAKRGGRFGGRGGQGEQGRSMPQGSVSDRLTRSALVRGADQLPALRGIGAGHHRHQPSADPLEDYDEIAALEFDNRDLQRLWSVVLGAAASIGSRPEPRGAGGIAGGGRP